MKHVKHESPEEQLEFIFINNNKKHDKLHLHHLDHYIGKGKKMYFNKNFLDSYEVSFNFFTQHIVIQR
ncbi:hypothetical protein T03_4746 [Trichinella britovi]|uniref:Uncharacterized protein n=1 Tax=Trichinella britovi TaxID=45882 RepID=A0A0V1DDC8_TRIBR|nr:hypothetical protein T03_4746 [Trichinella britovi]